MTIPWSAYEQMTWFDIVGKAPQLPGIYAIYWYPANYAYVIAYVGRAENIRARLLEHINRSEPNKKLSEMLGNGYSAFTFSVVEREADRKGIEKYLYDSYRDHLTLCNSIDPGGVPIPVNLPPTPEESRQHGSVAVSAITSAC